MDTSFAIDHCRASARYNQWANARVYADAATLSDVALHANVGIYFGSLFATLAHLLQTDRAWSFLLRGGALADMVLPPAPADFDALCTARIGQDADFITWVDGIDDAWLAEPFVFRSGLGSWRGMTYNGTHGSILAHVFNHQTQTVARRSASCCTIKRVIQRSPCAARLLNGSAILKTNTGVHRQREG